MKRKRLAPSVFKIPTDKLRCGYYTDRYFLRTRDVLIKDGRHVLVDYQFFPRQDSVICGLDEALAILKTAAGKYRDEEKAHCLYEELRHVQWKFQDASVRQKEKEIRHWQKERTKLRGRLNRLWCNGWSDLKVSALFDGDRVKKNEPVLTISGDPCLFVHLETALLGVLARPTSTASAVARVVRAAGKKHLFFFSARFDHYWSQTTDGYAALKAGAFAVSTDANADYWGMQSMGTMPHFIIGCYGGDTARAFLAFDRHTESAVNRIALVDWDNDCVRTTRSLIEALILKGRKPGAKDAIDFRREAPARIGKGKGKLWGVRFDTSARLRDKSVRGRSLSSYGVSPELVRRARQAFDSWGCHKLKIIVSGGFDEKKIRHFERMKVPVDAYGVGSSLLRQRVEMTADIVGMNGEACAKRGRRKQDWTRLRKVT